MNKHLATNGLALLLVVVGLALGNATIKTVGYFALSGAITNSLAIHMLFHKVPGLYGSGVIPARFEAFKLGIRSLIMDQFFTAANMQRFVAEQSRAVTFDLAPVIQKVDLTPTFDALIEVINASSFGGMLSMFGGTEALAPLRQPFVDKMTASILEISDDEKFKSLLKQQLSQTNDVDQMRPSIANIVDKRLDELTPTMVKDIVQKMIREHLGWLVVWGGVFGGIIGLIASSIPL